MTTTQTQPAIIVPPSESSALRDDDDVIDAETTRDETMRRDETMQSRAPDAGEKVPNRDLGTPYLNDQTSTQASERWQRIQAEFVDDPRRSVGEAHELVGDLMQRIVDAFTHERQELEGQWSKGSDVSTEDLRVCLQRYRAFFSRLLPLQNSGNVP